ncbi:hypothetical protein [Helicobacter sp. 12S02634-8]|uniref:restriction endonuclease n=1 Tax=Helicobacter sp. 12S02634-8 TaxID=1476199 RepID=UPI0031BAB975
MANTLLRPPPHICELIRADGVFKEILGEQYENILEHFSTPTLKEQVKPAALAQTIAIKKDRALEFRELWQAINAACKITYKNLSIQPLIDAIAKGFEAQKESFNGESFYLESKIYDALNDKIIIQSQKSLPQKNTNKYSISLIEEHLLAFAQENKLPLGFVISVVNALSYESFQNLWAYPFKGFRLLKTTLEQMIHTHVIQSVSYDFSSVITISPDDLLFDTKGEPRGVIEASKLGRFTDEVLIPQENYLYEKCVYDSQIEKQAITTDPESINHQTIKVFAKLPCFEIQTPYKAYRPDFAYLIEEADGSKIFFVCETKGYENYGDVSESERQKIDYAQKFFEALDKHLKDVKVIFAKRLNTQKLIEVLENVLKDHTNKKDKEKGANHD